MSEELPRYVEMLSANVSMIKQALSNIKDEIDTVKKVIDADKKEKEDEDVKDKVIKELCKNGRGQEELEELVKQGDFPLFKFLFEAIYADPRTPSKSKHIWVSPWGLAIIAIQQGNAEISTYLAKYIEFPIFILDFSENPLFQAIRAGSFEAFKSMCEAYQEKYPKRFKHSIKVSTYIKEKRTSPYQYAVSLIGQNNWPHKYNQYEEIAEYLEQFE